MVEHSIPEIEELIGAYALDAVDDDEREAVEQHLAVCPRCRAELADHQEVAALLAYDGAPAPTDVWDRIVISLEEPPPAMRLKLDAPDVPGDVMSLDDRRAKKQRRLYAAIVGVAAAIILVLGLVVVRQRDDTPNQQLALESLVDEALATPGATMATLRPPEGVNGPIATAVVTPDGRGFVQAGNLPELPANRTYQLWGVVDDQAISLGVLGTHPDIAAFQVDDGNRVAAYAITDEAAGGVIASQNDPVVVGETA